MELNEIVEHWDNRRRLVAAARGMAGRHSIGDDALLKARLPYLDHVPIGIEPDERPLAGLIAPRLCFLPHAQDYRDRQPQDEVPAFHRLPTDADEIVDFYQARTLLSGIPPSEADRHVRAPIEQFAEWLMLQRTELRLALLSADFDWALKLEPSLRAWRFSSGGDERPGPFQTALVLCQMERLHAVALDMSLLCKEDGRLRVDPRTGETTVVGKHLAMSRLRIVLKSQFFAADGTANWRDLPPLLRVLMQFEPISSAGSFAFLAMENADAKRVPSRKLLADAKRFANAVEREAVDLYAGAGSHTGCNGPLRQRAVSEAGFAATVHASVHDSLSLTPFRRERRRGHPGAPSSDGRPLFTYHGLNVSEVVAHGLIELTLDEHLTAASTERLRWTEGRVTGLLTLEEALLSSVAPSALAKREKQSVSRLGRADDGKSAVGETFKKTFRAMVAERRNARRIGVAGSFSPSNALPDGTRGSAFDEQYVQSAWPEPSSDESLGNVLRPRAPCSISAVVIAAATVRRDADIARLLEQQLSPVSTDGQRYLLRKGRANPFDGSYSILGTPEHFSQRPVRRRGTSVVSIGVDKRLVD